MKVFLQNFLSISSLVVFLFSCEVKTGPIVVNSSLSVRSKSEARMVLAWSQAQDKNGNTENLEYQLVSSESPDIETVSDINKKAKTVRTWGVNYTSTEVILTGSEKILYYNVMVRDVTGTISLYSPLMVDFTDKVGPTVEDKTLTISELTSKSIRIQWNPATDNITHQKDLVYIVMRSTKDNLGTSDAYYNNTDGRHTCYEKAATTSLLLEAFTPESTIWFNIFVRDSNGNVTPYTSLSATFLKSVTVDTTSPDSITYNYPLSPSETETLTLTVLESSATGSLPLESPLWIAVYRWAATYSGNSEGQGLYQFETLQLEQNNSLDLTKAQEKDWKLLANALTEYTNAYREPLGQQKALWKGKNPVARSYQESFSENKEATGFRLEREDSTVKISHFVGA